MVNWIFQDTSSPTSYDVVVVGGGAAGIGVAAALSDAGITHFIVLERYTVGASFALWPAETRFITPSFPTNSFGMLDLNSIALGVSPALATQTEHPTGEEYAEHLRKVASVFALPIREKTNVLRVTKIDDDFRIDTEEETLRAKHVIWAAGEFQYPKRNGFSGSEYCSHTASLISYQDLDGDDFLVIGGYESGIDAAYHLASRGKKVRVFDRSCPWEDLSHDPSVALSTYSHERMQEKCFKDHVELFPQTAISVVTNTDDTYEIRTEDGRSFQSKTPPILAGGFEGSCKLVADLFEQREDGFLLLNEQDESTIVPGMFLCGPAVRHDNHVFCFIYKYRQRFAVVAKAIANSLGLPAEGLELYRTWGMYLDDLSCCGEDCVC